MIRWEHMCLPRDFGGAGIINTRLLNEAFLLKWAWRIYSYNEEVTCYRLLESKYLSKKPFAKCNGKGGLNFGKG
jgi:hypothetical protein